MSKHLRIVALLVGGLALFATPSQARMLDLYEIYEMEQYIDCATNTCGYFCEPVWEEPQAAHYLQFVACETCLEDQGCGESLRLWEKDGVEPVTMEDHDRAILEQQCDGQPGCELCYPDDDENIVLPRELCAGTLCEGLMDACLEDHAKYCVEGAEDESPDIECDEQEHCWFATAPTTVSCPDFICDADAEERASFHSALLCVDSDGDQVPSWVETSLQGPEGGAACEPGANQCPEGYICDEGEFGAWVCQLKPCSYDAPCEFRETCELIDGVAIPTCQPRGVCSGDGSAVSNLPTEKDEPVGEICDPETGACLSCIYHSHCASGERCTASGTCVTAEACSNSLDCYVEGADTQTVCDATEGYCVECVSDAECGEDQICGPDSNCVTSCDSDQVCITSSQLCSFDSDGVGHCADCAGDEGCDYSSTCVRGTCQPRKCSDGEYCLLQPADEEALEAVCPELNCNANLKGDIPNCTAFHLEKVSEDDTEILVQIHYDHTPIPARVLDLYLKYDESQVLLQDARPLKPLGLKGKNLASSHLSDGTLVLNVYDDDGTHPIPKGPIIELVFRRVGVCPTEIGFATDRYDLLPMSVAPLQGSNEIQDTLADPDLWGAPIRICARSTIPTRLRLSYAYESLETPLEYANVPSGQEICERVPACINEEDEVIQARMIARLDAMQTGDILATETVTGVSGNAAYLNGSSDHVSMPIHYDTPLVETSQSFSFSTWFYGEGNDPGHELSQTPQVLYSHNAYNERTSFGLMLLDSASEEEVQLAFFLGDLLDTDLSGASILSGDGAQPLPAGACAETNFLAGASSWWVDATIGLRTWHHVAFTFNADTRVFELYFDGERAGCVEVTDLPFSSQCPQMYAATDVTIHDEGDVLGGRSPEYLWLGVAQGGLNKIQRMDPAGLQTETIIGDSEFNYQDPHYSSVLDRVVYSSDVSGSTEIWIANGDGSNRQQITVGFGDAGRGISARRPRFAPDGSAIVFDSNVFDVVKKDNHYARVRHIYFVEYDAATSTVAVELPDNSTTETLDYEERLADQTIEDYRLTDTLDRHHKAARWLTGADDTAVGRERGALLIDTSKDDQSGHRVYLLKIPTAFPLSSIEPVAGLGEADEVRLLDAFYSVKAAYPAPVLTSSALLTREDLLWEKDGESTVYPPEFFLFDGSDYSGLASCTTDSDCAATEVCQAPAGATEPLACVPTLSVCASDSDCATGASCVPIEGGGVTTYCVAQTVPAQFSVVCGSAGAACTGAGSTEITVRHTPQAYDARCWDQNFNNNLDDADHNADGTLDVADCYPPTQDIFLAYDYTRFEPIVDVVERCSEDQDCDGGEVCGLGDAQYAAGAPVIFKRCEIAEPTSMKSCLVDSDCCADGSACGYLCAASEPSWVCKAITPATVSCLTDSDCGAGSYVCSSNQCKAASAQPFICLSDADCASPNVCHAGGYCGASSPTQCTDASMCAGTDVCSPVVVLNGSQICVQAAAASCAKDGDCSLGERCESSKCVMLGTAVVDAAGVTTINQEHGCVMDLDCDGGQICGTDACVRVTQSRTCSVGGDADCAGGQVCSADGVCRPGQGAKPLCNAACTPLTDPPCNDCDVDNGAACETGTEVTACSGGESCDLGAGVCRDSKGEQIMSEAGLAISAWVGGKKDLELSSRYGQVGGVERGLVRIEIRSPLSADPIPSGDLVTVRFTDKGLTSYTPMTPQIYLPRIHSETGVKDLTSAAPPVLFDPDVMFEQVTGGAFAPDGESLMLGTITNARPHLLRTQDLEDSLQASAVNYYSLSEAERVTTSPLSVAGIEWVRQARTYPCNWLGAYLHFQSKAYMYGFRGGVEDTRIYSGLRDSDGIRSEAERGREFLEKMGLAGELDTKLPSCGNSHLECPPYHLCIESQCQMRGCDPNDPWSCADVGGRCTLRPISVEQEQTNPSGSSQGFDWVCSADCNNDNQCFTQVCLNGPCRFCDASLTCIECRDSVTQLGALTIAGIEGCPDQRSFACDSGACVTDCYSFEDGQSTYLCDEATEYCDAGQCVLLDWEWGDLAPATFAGIGEMRHDYPPNTKQGWGGYTEAVDQRVTIEIEAYGNSDWTHSPEMVVEVRGGIFYGSTWNRIAKIPVGNRTAVEAQNDPYIVNSSKIFEDMRLRLVTSSKSNPHDAATGLGADDTPFCIADQLSLGKTEEEAGTYCAHRAGGSRANLGYPIEISKRQQIDYCNLKGHSGCDYVKQSEHDYLLPGSLGVVVSNVSVDGAGVMNNITQNMVCHYEGGDTELTPKDDGVDSKIVYGALGTEDSNEAAGLLASCEKSQAPDDHTAIWTGDGEVGAAAIQPAGYEGASTGEFSDGVANGLTYEEGQVGQALSFDEPSDYLSIPPEAIAGSDAFSVEAWLRTGDLHGGILSIASRPESCAEWRERGRNMDGDYAIWVNNRYVPVYCHGMNTEGVEPRAYVTLKSTNPEANTSIYRAGGGSFGTTVKTIYSKVGLRVMDSGGNTKSLALDLSDTTWTTSNGGHLGHDCKPADPSDVTQPGCFLKSGELVHLWRGEASTDDVLDGAGNSQGVTFAPGRVGEAMVFGAQGASIESVTGLPELTTELSVEGWIKTSATTGKQVLARMGEFRSAPEVLRGPTEAGSGDCVAAGGAAVPDEYCTVTGATIAAGEVCCEIAWMKEHQGAWEFSIEGSLLRFQLVGSTRDVDGQAAVLLGAPSDPVVIGDGNWHHVAVTLGVNTDGDHVALLYVDGAQIATSVADDGSSWTVPSVMTQGSVVLGQGRLGHDQFVGSLDDVAIWSAALTLDELQNIEYLGQPGTGKAGDGFGKCLLEEVDTLVACGSEDYVTQLPLGVAYGCMGPSEASTMTLDLSGTPLSFSADIAESFKKASATSYNKDDLGLVTYSPTAGQMVTLSGAGSCDGVGPVSWNGDPTAEPASSGTAVVGDLTLVTLPVSLLGEAAVASQWCSGGDDCLMKTYDELLVVSLAPQGLSVRSGNESLGESLASAAETVDHKASDLNDYDWHHLAVVRSASTLRIYVDGQEIFFDHTVSLLKPALLDAVDWIIVGQEGHCAAKANDCDNSSSAFAGRIDELAFYDRALKTSEITTLSGEGRRGRPVADRPDPECPDIETGLVAFDAQSEGIALLNCNFVDSDPTGDQASIMFQNVIVERLVPAASGSVTYDTGDVCLIEVTPNLTIPCYGWIGDDANTDPYNDLTEVGASFAFQTLDVSLARSFGHDEGFERIELPKYPVKANVTFPKGGTGAVSLDWEPASLTPKTPMGPGFHELMSLTVNRSYDVRILESPPGFKCYFKDSSDESCGTCAGGQTTEPGTMTVLDIECLVIRSVNLDVTFQEEDGTPISSPDLVDDLVVDGSVAQGLAQLHSSRFTLGASDASNGSHLFEGLEPTDNQDVSLSLITSPAGFACSIDGAHENFSAITTDVTASITCVADPRFPLSVSTVGLSTQSTGDSCDATSDLVVTFRELEDGQGGYPDEAVCIQADGVSPSTTTLLGGGSWSAEITGQPQPADGSRIRCALEEGAETMTVGADGSSTEAAVQCETPTVSVPIMAMGLFENITIGLNVVQGGQTSLLSQHVITAPAPSPIPDEVSFDFPELLFEDEGFEIVALDIPESMECQMPPAFEALTTLPADMVFFIACTLKPEPTYNLGGAVTGLTAPGLVLQTEMGAVSYEVGASDTTFTFDYVYSAGHEYIVEVQEHPEEQFCTVLNGEGAFPSEGAQDIKNVIVYCQNVTTIEVDVTTPSGYGDAYVQAKLIKVGTGGYMAGEITPEERLQASGGAASFSMTGEPPTGNLQDQDPDQTEPTTPPFTSGQYFLTVWLTQSSNTSMATGDPIFLKGQSKAATQTIWLNAPLPKTLSVSLNANDFKTTVGGPVTILPATPLAALDKGQKILCAWSPWNGAAPVPPFKFSKGDTQLTNLFPPILGYSIFKCEDTNGCKIVTQQEFLAFIQELIESGEEPDPSAPVMVGAVGTGMEDYPLLHEDALPAGETLDLTCWADSKDSDLGGVVDDGDTGVLSKGDSYGRLENAQSGVTALITLKKFTDQ